MYDILIIGAGPAGMTAGIYAKRANLKVAMIEKYIPGGQIINTNEIENYTGFPKLRGFELATNMLKHTEEIGVELIYDEVITIKDLGKTKEVVTNGNTYETKVVILATGTVPRKLNVENEEQLSSNGISWCAICDGPIYKNKDIIVIGGGNSAVEEAAYLATLGRKIVVIQDLPHLTADQKAQDILKSRPNVTIRYSSKVTKFLMDDQGKMQGVEINNENNETEQILGDGAFEYIGLIPVTNMVEELGITNDYGYIIANDKMETTIPGIYSAGDVNVKQIRQVVTATADGAIAVQNALKYLDDLR